MDVGVVARPLPGENDRLVQDRPLLELWGGVECTVNRVGDAVLDQVERSGHAARLDDLDRFADLGITALRTPILWERTAPVGLAAADWRWADARLGRLRELGVRPIVGLVHHGSGPRGTDLLDPGFVAGLAAFAGAVAARYPWVEDWTPVNEPLTTARFAALYGHWYPHRRDELSFARALLIQCRAVAAAMRRIRAVNPAARLVQTEDVGRVWSTPALRFQADFENERRWLSFDLLAGRVDPDHRMWHHLRWLGIPEAELGSFLDEPCPPDVVGVNHYLTSERFLDERLGRYPAGTHGGNAALAYADVEAVRVLEGGLAGPGGVLREAWDRYQRPLAVTEAHLGCSREEQLRWFAQIWAAAQALRCEGVDLRAVTAWSLLGAFDWDSLLTDARGHYEPGVFDLRAPRPRPTALAPLLRRMAAGADPDHPVLGAPGWWERLDRLRYPAVDPARVPALTNDRLTAPPAEGAPILLLGGDGLAAAVARCGDARALRYRRIDAEALRADPAAIDAAIDDAAPWAVVDGRDPMAVGARAAAPAAAAAWAAACADRGIPLLVFSGDRVFSGTKTDAYVEADGIDPVDETGRLLAEMERRVLIGHPAALVLRAGPLFDPAAEGDAAAAALRALAAGAEVAADDDAVVSPTFVPDLVGAALDLLIDGERGVWHLVTPGAVTPAELLRRLAAGAGLDPTRVRSEATDDGPAAHRTLASARGWIMPSLADVLERCDREGRLAAAVGGAADHPLALANGGSEAIRRVS